MIGNRVFNNYSELSLFKTFVLCNSFMTTVYERCTNKIGY